MKIACENPQIIFNPSIVWLFATKKYRHLVLNGRTLDYPMSRNYFYNMPWHDLYQAKDEVTVDTVDNYIMVNDDGDIQPLFMAVPCGKCRLCRDRKCDDWETRCVCESAASDYPPLFITLTYRPEDRPETSEDCKRDFQLFMKRLRQNVSRHLGVKDHELRYFARSEKTPKNGYWHIHMILWNMPFVSCAEGDKNSFQALIRFIQVDSWQKGICRVERCRDNSGAYVMKYARKEDCNPEYWQLASRRNGIGNKFAMDLLPTVLRNPDMTCFYVPGEKRPRAIPSYFKRLWFPTLSVLFPADVCKASKDFMECSTRLFYFMSLAYPENYACNRCRDILDMVEYVSEKYDIMHIDFDDAQPNRRYCRDADKYIRTRDALDYVRHTDERRSYIYIDTRVTEDMCLEVHRIPSLTPSTDKMIPVRNTASLDTPEAYSFRRELIAQWSLLKRSYEILLKFEFDRAEFLRRLAVTAAHQEYVRSVVDDLPEVDVDSLVHLHECDRQWVETHWMQKEIG